MPPAGPGRSCSNGYRERLQPRQLRFRRHRLEGVGNEQGLIGIEAFGAWAVDPPQEEVEAVLQLVVLAPRVTQRGEQFDDHLPEDVGIIRQRRGGISEGLRDSAAKYFHSRTTCPRRPRRGEASFANPR